MRRAIILFVSLGLALGACDDTGATGTVDAVADVSADVSADAVDTVASDAEVTGDTDAPSDTSAPADAAADSVAPVDTGPPPSCPEEAVTVYLYEDGNGASNSWYDQPLGSDDLPLSGEAVSITRPDGGVTAARDCGPGRYGFLDLPAGAYLLDVAVDGETTSHNLGRRLPRAVADGAVKLVAFGDSVPAYGPAPWFPEQLETLLAPFVTVTLSNVAIPGSQSSEWLPGGSNYVNRLAPHLADADVVVFSLGGNDLMNLASDFEVLGVEDALALLDDLDAAIVAIEANLLTIYGAVRAAAPDADVVWLVYPNYAMSDRWAQYLGDYQELAATLLASKLEGIRERMGDVAGLTLADMYGSLDKPALDAFLWDELHLNVAGHRYYAEEVFMTLGGVLVGPPTSRGVHRSIGFRP